MDENLGRVPTHGGWKAQAHLSPEWGAWRYSADASSWGIPRELERDLRSINQRNRGRTAQSDGQEGAFRFLGRGRREGWNSRRNATRFPEL